MKVYSIGIPYLKWNTVILVVTGKRGRLDCISTCHVKFFLHVVHHKNLRTIPTYFPTPHRTPWNPHRISCRGTYIGHAELSYHGPCHAFHLLQVTTSTWHGLMDDSTLKLVVGKKGWKVSFFGDMKKNCKKMFGVGKQQLVKFCIFLFFFGCKYSMRNSDATGHFCWDSGRPPGVVCVPEATQQKHMTWHDTGYESWKSQNWKVWRSRRTLRNTQSNPCFFGGSNDSYGSTKRSRSQRSQFKLGSTNWKLIWNPKNSPGFFGKREHIENTNHQFLRFKIF